MPTTAAASPPTKAIPMIPSNIKSLNVDTPLEVLFDLSFELHILVVIGIMIQEGVQYLNAFVVLAKIVEAKRLNVLQLGGRELRLFQLYKSD